MARPGLDDPAELAEYRGALRRYLRPWRLVGLTIVTGAALWLVWKDGDSIAAWTSLAVGWAILIAIIVTRTRYHKRRMSEPA